MDVHVALHAQPLGVELEGQTDVGKVSVRVGVLVLPLVEVKEKATRRENGHHREEGYAASPLALDKANSLGDILGHAWDGQNEEEKHHQPRDDDEVDLHRSGTGHCEACKREAAVPRVKKKRKREKLEGGDDGYCKSVGVNQKSEEEKKRKRSNAKQQAYMEEKRTPWTDTECA